MGLLIELFITICHLQNEFAIFELLDTCRFLWWK